MLAVVLANIKFSFYYLFISNLNYVEVLYIYYFMKKKIQIQSLPTSTKTITSNNKQKTHKTIKQPRIY